MGGATDLVTGARRVIVAMTHTAKGQPKLVEVHTLPVTFDRCVDLIVTELAVIQPTPQGLLLKELAPGISVDAVQRATRVQLIVPDRVLFMDVGLAGADQDRK